MEPIAVEIETWLEGKRHIKKARIQDVRADGGFRVRSFSHLVAKVAYLTNYNQGMELLFRGQGQDTKNRNGDTAIYATILRPPKGKKNLGPDDITARLSALDKASKALATKIWHYSMKGSVEIIRSRVLQWSILQHYEITPTPLLDVTHSLRVACSFWCDNKQTEQTWLYVIGVPFVGGGVTTSADQGLQAVRLLTVCPPTAYRPHFQEAYLVGQYPEISASSIEHTNRNDGDFGKRLICKFKIPPAKEFWIGGFQPLPWDTLFPPNDPFLSVTNKVKESLTT